MVFEFTVSQLTSHVQVLEHTTRRSSSAANKLTEKFEQIFMLLDPFQLYDADDEYSDGCLLCLLCDTDGLQSPC